MAKARISGSALRLSLPRDPLKTGVARKGGVESLHLTDPLSEGSEGSSPWI